MKIRLKTNVIVDGKIIEADSVIDGDPILVDRGLAEFEQPEKPKPAPVVEKEEKVEVEHSPREPEAAAPSVNAEDEREHEEDLAADTEPSLAKYCQGGWYELEDGRKVRRKDLPPGTKIVR